MRNKYIDYLLVNDDEVRNEIKNAETMDEAQLIMLTLIRNNLKTIKNWITFFAVIAIISAIINLVF